MGKESELRNGTIISMIERKLPDKMRAEWLERIAEASDGDSDEKFKPLLNMLNKWKIMIEYDQASIRKTSDTRSTTHFAGASHQVKKSNTCWIHVAEKHPIWVCQAFKAKTVAERIALTKQNHACEACLEINCTGVTNVANCKKQFKCVIPNCNKLHNKLLHQ